MAPSARRRIFSRARKLAKQLRRTQLLWVDDDPGGTSWSVGCCARDAGESGLELPARLAHADPRPPPLIFYVTTLREGTPVGAVGITDRPDTLMDLILDCVEEQKH
jgi:hypothetical protein